MSGAEWGRLYAEAGEPELDARSVVCPTCGAGVGVYCRRPSGHKATSAHALRWDDAVLALPAARPLIAAGLDEQPSEPSRRSRPTAQGELDFVGRDAVTS